MTKQRKLITGLAATALAGCIAFGVAGPALAGSAPPDSPPIVAGPAGASATVTVTGTGSVTVEPDTAILSVGVQATAPTGAEAMDQVSDDSNALTEALVSAGIDPLDIQTSGLSLWSTFGDDGMTVTGYQASLSVNVTVRDLAALGSTIDAAQETVGEGFTIGGVQFSFADPESVLPEARADAIANATTIAGQYAEAAGMSLGSVVSIVESGASFPIDMYRAGSPAMAESSVAISPGTLQLTAQVSVTFSLNA